jgi:hypothetical protein
MSFDSSCNLCIQKAFVIKKALARCLSADPWLRVLPPELDQLITRGADLDFASNPKRSLIPAIG